MANAKASGLAQFTRRGPASPQAAPASEDVQGGPGARKDTAAGAPAAGSPSEGVGRGASKPKLVGVYLMPDGHRQLKVEAAKRGATVSDLVREALNAWFANEQLPPLA